MLVNEWLQISRARIVFGAYLSFVSHDETFTG